ncbi:xylulose kinase [Pseudarthrobacter sulfonivorans]|uniref:Xylulose kinase n=1 Tax=Pseudarthrobacter sulfonivorans TaxID=121292 RepID=A0A0U3Q9Z0_9MICC|nr:FGGY family carbohydrate kinase [Pseudarthrobacter sulfonivorans]ALV43582.1 xylulose kinase [Pseudarthrobacter sulfonivorans]
MTLVAGVDSSTQSCKVTVLDAQSGVLVREGRASHPDGTEVHPDHWWRALSVAIDDAGGLADVDALSVAGQQHGMVLLDRDGNVVRPALLWNDTRSAAAAAALIDEVGAEEFARRTGLVPVASFTVTKVRWVRDNEPENVARVAAVALPHDWLSWRLRGYGPAGASPLGPDLDALTTDRSDASGTGYWSPASGSYDVELFRLAFGRDAREARQEPEAAGPAPVSAAPAAGGAVILPRVLAAGEAAGRVHPLCFAGSNAGADTGTDPSTDAVADAGGAGGGERGEILLGAGAGDNAAAALGLGARPGDVVVSVGTSGTVFAVASEAGHDPSGTVAGFAGAGGDYLPIAVTLNAARVLSSMAALLDIGFDELSRLALEAAPGAGGVVLVPYFEGERTPNLPQAKASLHGLSIASATRSNIARAAIEGMLCGLSGGLAALQALGYPAGRLLLIGGAVQNPAVQKIASQVFDLPVVVPSPGEYVARGAAAQAAWALTGARPDWPVALAAAPASDFQPVIGEQYARACGHIAQDSRAAVSSTSS